MDKNVFQQFAIHPLSLLRMVWKRKLFIAAGWIVASVGGYLYVRQMPNFYKAESLILVDPQKVPERFVASTVQVALQDLLSSISQQVLSATELQKVIEQFNLYAEARKVRSPEQIIDRMRKEISINVVRNSMGGGSPGAFTVSYEGANPMVVAGIVNHVSSLFIRESLKTREMRAQGTSAFLEGQLNEARKELENQETMLSRFKLERMGELPQQEAALLGALNRMQTELQGNQEALKRAEQSKLMLETTLRLAESSEAALVRTMTPSSPQTASPTALDAAESVAVKQRSEVLQEQLELFRQRYTDQHPEMKRLQAQIEDARKREALAAPPSTGAPKPERQNRTTALPSPNPLSPVLVAELNRERERIATTRLQLDTLTKEIQARSADRERILRMVREHEGRVERIPLREQQMTSITRDYDISRQNYRTLLDKKLSAEMSEELERRQQAERFTLQDPARVPTTPIRPKREMLYVAISLAGLVLSLVLTLAAEIRKNQFQGEWELPTGIPVLGRVSLIAHVSSPKATLLKRSA